MLIFTNCLSDKADEGCLNVASNLVKRLKSGKNGVTVVSFERQSEDTDLFVKSNKLLFTKEIIKAVNGKKDSILYIPFPSKSLSAAIRVFVLTLLSRRKINVLFTQITDICFAAKILLKISSARFFVVSEDSRKKLAEFIDEKRVVRLKTGIQTDRFTPVSAEKSAELKEKFGFKPDKPLVLHVGHMKSGRNTEQLLKINSEYQVVLVTSTLTRNEQDNELKERLSSRKNIRIIDEYVPFIEEIYQLSDLYFFPVIREDNCIDVPLSCLEAASCNKPIVTTDFGEMKEFKDKNGFFFMDSFDETDINTLIYKALNAENIETRSAVLEYDWKNTVKLLTESID